MVAVFFTSQQQLKKAGVRSVQNGRGPIPTVNAAKRNEGMYNDEGKRT